MVFLVFCVYVSYWDFLYVFYFNLLLSVVISDIDQNLSTSIIKIIFHIYLAALFYRRWWSAASPTAGSNSSSRRRPSRWAWTCLHAPSSLTAFASTTESNSAPSCPRSIFRWRAGPADGVLIQQVKMIVFYFWLCLAFFFSINFLQGYLCAPHNFYCVSVYLWY